MKALDKDKRKTNKTNKTDIRYRSTCILTDQRKSARNEEIFWGWMHLAERPSHWYPAKTERQETFSFIITQTTKYIFWVYFCPFTLTLYRSADHSAMHSCCLPAVGNAHWNIFLPFLIQDLQTVTQSKKRAANQRAYKKMSRTELESLLKRVCWSSVFYRLQKPVLILWKTDFKS